MNDPLPSAIRSALDRVWTTQGRQFLSLEWESDRGEELWMQYLDGQLNLAWPLEDTLERALSRAGLSLPRGVFLLSEHPGSAILAAGDVLQDDLAAWTAQLLRKVFELPSPELPDIRVLDHG